MPSFRMNGDLLGRRLELQATFPYRSKKYVSHSRGDSREELQFSKDS